MNFKLIAIKLGEGLKYDTTINDINRIASATFDFPLTDYPYDSITSSRSQLIYSWVMTLANQSINVERKNQLLNEFVEGLTLPNNNLRKLVNGLKSPNNEITRKGIEDNKTQLIQLINEGENFIRIMKGIDAGDKSASLHKYEILQWLDDVNRWTVSNNCTIPEPGNIFNIVLWDQPVLAFVLRVTHLLQSFKNDLKKDIQFEYDFALSFAGEDRKDAEKLAECLRRNKIRVFYDEYEKAEL
jgi:hypothetical protein